MCCPTAVSYHALPLAGVDLVHTEGERAGADAEEADEYVELGDAEDARHDRDAQDARDRVVFPTQQTADSSGHDEIQSVKVRE